VAWVGHLCLFRACRIFIFLGSLLAHGASPFFVIEISLSLTV
jgi:hypothetical protein